jgi:hypothetical protein
MFELTPSKIECPIVFREGGRKFSVVHTVRTPTFEDWSEYETRLNRAVEIEGGNTVFTRERAEAAEAVWDRVIISVHGYRVGEHDEQLAEAFPSGWREKVPLFHKMAAIELLAQVFSAEPGGEEDDEAAGYRFDPDHITIHLAAGRDGVEHPDLVHVLKRPTARQQKDFSRVLSSAVYVRGSRTEKSLLPSRLREAVRFYDELIESVRGYAVSGAPPTREETVRAMDALHKQAAVQSLFATE